MSGSDPRTGSVELHVTSNYSFLRGASHVEEQFLAARAMGHDTLAITDWHSLAGIARAHARAVENGVRLVAGAGPGAMQLTPHLGTQTFGRGDFEMHGESIRYPGNASEGCIILPPKLRRRLDLLPSRTLTVVR